ncbi:porphobilinogen deaminase [Dacryopinax primogenitus]|uniref:Porphobilinogen deaminase n=1 Tax=Dacryopinax primogenitus (strain DJM 731) TaxID=1858805 RepID=M5G547_DACPD|nr:porphobilinogen deaminase [Dacryopinax primogenitus]EJT98877.1 porphobilinogen deaminase [Dacryopinax primogenitus]
MHVQVEVHDPGSYAVSINSTPSNPYIIGSRASKLALIQANLVLSSLRIAHPTQSFDILTVSVEGDRNKSQALYLLGGKSLWTKELELELLGGGVDMIVHSLKDVPTTLPEGCELGAVLSREDPRDSLVVKSGLEYKTLEDLPQGSVVGTSSVRRVAQLKRTFPHLQFQDVRGNLDTRIAKLDAATGPYTALILARAGLVRMGWGERISSDLSAPSFLHAVGQGALGVEVRSGDQKVAELLRGVGDQATEWRTTAERAMLRVLEGGCSVPVGAHTVFQGQELTLLGSVTSLDGTVHVQREVVGVVSSEEEAREVGERCARLLVQDGAGEILKDIGKDREARAAA